MLTERINDDDDDDDDDNEQNKRTSLQRAPSRAYNLEAEVWAVSM